jgi:tight adherence protein C
MSSVTVYLILLVAVLVGAISMGVGAFVSNRRRLQLLSRAGVGGAGSKLPAITLRDPNESATVRFGAMLQRLLPEGAIGSGVEKPLVQAGFESPAAAPVYAAIRILSALLIPGAMFAWGPRDSTTMFMLWATISVGLGVIAPSAILERLRRLRQERIRRSIPDSLDLLLVCVEAGVSLDAAILRVGREMAVLHPELSNEFLLMNRRMNAGLRREEALQGLFQRTGVEELRALAANMIQSERWGTSIAKVLRVYSETLRRKRRQAAEKKAAVAATKMIFPLALFILPALFAVIGGPAALAMGPFLDAFGGGK